MAGNTSDNSPPRFSATVCIGVQGLFFFLKSNWFNPNSTICLGHFTATSESTLQKITRLSFNVSFALVIKTHVCLHNSRSDIHASLQIYQYLHTLCFCTHRRKVSRTFFYWLDEDDHLSFFGISSIYRKQAQIFISLQGFSAPVNSCSW